MPVLVILLFLRNYFDNQEKHEQYQETTNFESQKLFTRSLIVSVEYINSIYLVNLELCTSANVCEYQSCRLMVSFTFVSINLHHSQIALL